MHSEAMQGCSQSPCQDALSTHIGTHSTIHWETMPGCTQCPCQNAFTSNVRMHTESVLSYIWNACHNGSSRCVLPRLPLHFIIRSAGILIWFLRACCILGGVWHEVLSTFWIICTTLWHAPCLHSDMGSQCMVPCHFFQLPSPSLDVFVDFTGAVINLTFPL